MADALDLRVDFGKDNDLMELLETLHDVNDPVAILSMCEDRDEEEGLPPGSTLQLYYVTNFISRSDT